MSEIFGHSSKESDRDGEDYNEMCEYCGQFYDGADLHYVRLTLASGGKVVNRCEACRLDMKQHIVSKT